MRVHGAVIIGLFLRQSRPCRRSPFPHPIGSTAFLNSTCAFHFGVMVVAVEQWQETK